MLSREFETGGWRRYTAKSSVERDYQVPQTTRHAVSAALHRAEETSGASARTTAASETLMKAFAVFAIIVALSLACAGTVASVQLQPEKDSELHLGQSAAFSVPSNGDYSVGSAGTALVLIKQQQKEANTVYFYRAAAIGPQTIVATPKDPGPDGCVSCVTVHYFVTVIE